MNGKPIFFFVFTFIFVGCNRNIIQNDYRGFSTLDEFKTQLNSRDISMYTGIVDADRSFFNRYGSPWKETYDYLELWLSEYGKIERIEKVDLFAGYKSHHLSIDYGIKKRYIFTYEKQPDGILNCYFSSQDDGPFLSFPYYEHEGKTFIPRLRLVETDPEPNSSLMFSAKATGEPGDEYHAIIFYDIANHAGEYVFSISSDHPENVIIGEGQLHYVKVMGNPEFDYLFVGKQGPTTSWKAEEVEVEILKNSEFLEIWPKHETRLENP